MHPINRRTACTQVCFILTLGARFALTVTARAQAPRVVGGVPQDPTTVCPWPIPSPNRRRPNAARPQYFEMLGHRGSYQDGWYAVTLP